MNAAPLWTAAQALRLTPRPVLTIGDRPGSPYELGRIVGAARLRGGQIVVAAGGSRQLRFFDSTGMFVGGAARRERRTSANGRSFADRARLTGPRAPLNR